jgi:divalent metal cation (Fe/Co/Zn/Cd) transporter
MANEKEQVALSSIAASGGLAIAKALVGLATGSLAILSEAGHSLIDLGATVMTYVAVRVSGKPADEEHHYGHGKIEAVSALAETALLFLLSAAVIWQAALRLSAHQPHRVDANAWAFGVILISMAVDFFRSRSLSRIAQKTSSHALAADALHFSSDKVPGVVAVERVRARAVGDQIFIDLNVAVSRALPLDRVSAIKQAIAEAIRRQMPGAEPLINTTPVALDNETILDRVMVIARNRALAVHHVTVYELMDRLTVSLDLEVDGKLTLQAAHELADGLEDAIAAELGTGVEVETHIEPLQPQDVSGREAPPERVKAVALALSELAAESRAIRDVHEVRVRETDDGEIVNFHCHADPALSVQNVHEKVDALERALRERSPQIKRVIGHAEPMRE